MRLFTNAGKVRDASTQYRQDLRWRADALVSGIAKITAFSVQRHASSQTPHRKNTSIALHQFTCSDAAGREPFGEDIAARNLKAKNCNGGKTMNPCQG